MPDSKTEVAPWMPIYYLEYERDTQDLTPTEHGAYLLLIFYYWRMGGPITSDLTELMYQSRCNRIPDGMDVLQRVMSFFVEENGRYRHKRVDEELQKASARIRSATKRTENARTARRKVAELSSAGQERIDAMWAAYPADKRRGKAKAEERFAQLTIDDQVQCSRATSNYIRKMEGREQYMVEFFAFIRDGRPHKPDEPWRDYIHDDEHDTDGEESKNY